MSEPSEATAALEARLRAQVAGLTGSVDQGRLAATAEREGLLDVAWCEMETPIGHLVLAATPTGLLSVSFGSVDETLEAVTARVSPRVLEHPARLDLVRSQLDDYFEGRRRRFDLSLDRRLSRGFRAQVLASLEVVAYGETVTYGELAARAGNPKAFRAVGSAMATNPIPIVVPCHRVLRTGGQIGGYAGGVEAKRWLLDHEGASAAPR